MNMKSIYVSIFASFASLLFTCSLAYASQPQASSSESLAQQQNSLIRYFFAAARTGESDVIKTFLNAGFPINQTNPQSYTALMVAAYHGQSDIVDTLLAHGADSCIQDKRGNTAIMGALIKGEFSIAKTLYGHECDPNLRNKAGMTLNEFAEFWGQQDRLAGE